MVLHSPTGRKIRGSDPAVCPQDSAALRQARDADLSERLIEEIQRRFPRPGSRRSRALGLDADEADTSCIQLLVCKAGPFLRGMQRSLRPVLLGAAAATEAPAAPKGDPGAAPGAPGAPAGQGQSGAGRQRPEEVDASWRRLSPVQRMFAHMPTAGEVLDRADTCAQRFPNCKVSIDGPAPGPSPGPGSGPLAGSGPSGRGRSPQPQALEQRAQARAGASSSYRPQPTQQPGQPNLLQPGPGHPGSSPGRPPESH